MKYTNTSRGVFAGLFFGSERKSRASSAVVAEWIGGTSPFGSRRPMPVYVEASVLELARVLVNGGRRGFLVGIDPRVFIELLGARPVRCAL